MPEIITTKQGKIEVEIEGTGLPVIAIHGSPGGWDGAKMMHDFLPSDKFQKIAFSRPGYLGTPLNGKNDSIDHEADLIASLLESLQIKRAAVLAWSGGGPSAYRLAVRYPEQISTMVMIAAVSERWICPPYPASDRFLYGTTFGKSLVHFLANVAPKQIISGALAGEGKLSDAEVQKQTENVMAHPAQRKAVLDVAKTMNWVGKRKPGWDNDVKNYAKIDSLELEKIRCPVLIVQGEVDTDVLPFYSENAHKCLNKSQLIMVKNGTHLAFYAHPDAEKIQAQAERWFLEHL
ncbi:alpha/beta fold hydrolase [Lactococcus protaetiae]|uniref:Alpha/beta hydrolase n=1 Tax=Lactococcus protaetiae TaxID=2592653 RepID=A0A514Z926_9LACT|nr:alpha/beta hydrolase [Lactococcus protaetiae]QDK71037.1 alpha/beta hydrolase [Lactococcus protaetiae]